MVSLMHTVEFEILLLVATCVLVHVGVLDVVSCVCVCVFVCKQMLALNLWLINSDNKFVWTEQCVWWRVLMSANWSSWVS